MADQAIKYLLDVVFGLFTYALLLRFVMQWLRAPFRNPLGQAVVALTDWIVKPLRRVIPGWKGIDWASLVATVLFQFLWLLSYALIFGGFTLIGIGIAFLLVATLVALIKAALWLLIVVTVLYVGTAAALTGMTHYTDLDVTAPLAAALQSKGLTFAGTLVTLGILAGMTSSLLVGNLSQPRVLLAMARDGLLPLRFFGAIHPRFKTPWKSTILVGVVVSLGGALAPLGFLADLVSIGTLFAFVVVSASVWLLRTSDPDLPRAFRAPFVPFVSTMGVLVNGGLMFWLGRENWIRLIIWLAVGLVIYFGYSRRHSILNREHEAAGVASGD